MSSAVTTRTPALSYVEWLRTQDDGWLSELLRARPDVARPAPPDLGTLAGRLIGQVSISRALDQLDAGVLQVVEAMVLLPIPVATSELGRQFAGAAPEDLARSIEQLTDLGLVWGSAEGLHLVEGTRLLVRHPCGLGRRLVELTGPPEPDLESVLASLADLGPDERVLVERLAAGPPLGTLPAGWTADEQPLGTISRLLARSLLVQINDSTVELPREIGLMLRQHHVVSPTRPVLLTRKVGVDSIDRAAAHEAASLVAKTEAALELFAESDMGVLRAGGLGVRDLKRLAKELDVAESVTALVVEIAYAAALLDQTKGSDPQWVPTAGYDRWLISPPEDRWLVLARAWLTMTRMPGLVGLRDERDKALSALSQEVERSSAPVDRKRVLDVLTETAPGTTVTTDGVIDVLAWLAPRRGGRLRDALPAWILTETGVVGISGRDGLSTFGRALLEGRDRDAARALSALLPEPLDHFLVQPDLTVVAPGPLTRPLAQELAQVADVESTGGATVYRVTEATVRRALDLGRSGSDLHELFRSRSKTPVPQSLAYLIDDVAKRHGRMRVGASTSYLRCDDEALLSQLLATKQTALLGLRRLAPTVITSQAPVNQVLQVLRDLGHAPAAEAADGAVLIKRPESRRTAVRQRSARHGEVVPMADEQVRLAVGALRAGDIASRAARRAPVTTSSSVDTLAFLQEAAREGRQVWLGYVDAQGHSTSRVVEPRTVEGGYVTAYDHLRQEDRTFSVHRVTGVADIDAGERETE